MSMSAVRQNLVGFCAVLVALTVPAPATAQECTAPLRTYDLARVQAQGGVIRGPVELVVDGLNRVRYDIVLGQEITLLAPEDLSAVSFFPAPAQVDEEMEEAAAATREDETPPTPLSTSQVETLTRKVREGEGSADDRKAALEALADQVDREVRAIEDAVGALVSEVRPLTRKATTARAALLGCSNRFDELVDESDSHLRNGGADALAAEVQEVLGCIQRSRSALEWPDAAEVASVRGRIEGQKKERGELPFVLGFAEWYTESREHEKRYERLGQRVEGLLSVLASLSAESDATKAFRQGVDALGDRERLLRTLIDPRDRTAPFRLSHCVPCGFPRFRTQETKVTLVQTERFPAQGKEPRIVRTEVATIVCPSRFTVATGMGVAQVEEKSFTLVDSLPDSATSGTDGNEIEPDPLIQRISAESTADPAIVATAVIHTELWSWIDEAWGDPLTRRSPVLGLHFTAGASLQLDGGSESPLGYLAGLSLSLQERLFLTVGWQFHRVTRLAGGFEEGQQVPDALAAPPTRTEWDDGLAFTVTYRPRS